jgi:MFS transporter, DHA2 family, methylenomycin A resistance protein
MPDVGLPATTATAGHRQGWVLLTLCLGVLVAQVDTSVVNLAIQPIGAAFRASVPGLQWVLVGCPMRCCC